MTLRLRVLRRLWWLGNPIVLLLARWTSVWGVVETRGRQTGLARRVPIALTRNGAIVWVVVAQGRNAGFVRNIEANSSVRIRIKDEWLDGVAVLEPQSTKIPESVGRYARGAALLFPDQYRLLRIDLVRPPQVSGETQG